MNYYLKTRDYGASEAIDQSLIDLCFAAWIKDYIRIKTAVLDKKGLLKSDQYFPVENRKDYIFLHHTVGGTIESAIHWWNTDPGIVGTAFVVGEDGKIVTAFPAKCYAYQLGIGNGAIEKASIGIEMVNSGPLILSDKNYYMYDRISKATLYKGPVIAPVKPFRGVGVGQRYSAFEPYTYEAIITTIITTLLLCEEFGIPNVPATPFPDTMAEFKSVPLKSGVYSHTHVRKDKNDVHPGFPWVTFSYILKNYKTLFNTSDGRKIPSLTISDVVGR